MIGPSHTIATTSYATGSDNSPVHGYVDPRPYQPTKLEEKQELSRVAFEDAIEHEPQPAGDEPANDTDNPDDRVTELEPKPLPFSPFRSPAAGAVTLCGGRA